VAVRDPLFVAGVDQQEARAGLAALWTPGSTAVKGKTGLRPGPGNPGAVTATGTPDANIHVAPFAAVIDDSRATNGGTYLLVSDTTVDLNVFGGPYGAPAHASLARNDLVIAYLPDTFYGDANSTPIVRTVVGTPSGSPADPSLPAGTYPNAITLYRVRVNAGATTINSGNLTDLRPTWTVAIGGMLPVASQTARNALTGLYDGHKIWRTDRDWCEVYDGAAWRVQGVPIVANTADLAAITNPLTGQVAYSNGDGLLYKYNGSAWRPLGLYTTTQTLGASAAQVTFTVPTYLKNFTVEWTCRCDGPGGAQALNLRINNESGAAYFGIYETTINTTANTPVNSFGAAQARIGAIPGVGTASTQYAGGRFSVYGWNRPHEKLNLTSDATFFDTAVNSFLERSGWLFNSNGPYTTIQIYAGIGNLLTGSQFTLTGWE